MTLQKKWIIFDGDNTLWDVELLYNTARNDFCNWVASYGFSYVDVEIYQQEEDSRLYEEFGYSITRFPLSFENTLKHFLSNCTFEQMQYANKIAQSVFKSSAAPYPGVRSLLEELHKKFNLALLTCGDPLVQRKRIDDFESSYLLTKIYVVEEKSISTYEKVIKELKLDPSSSWMIGDSLKSDIIPANQLGMNTILVTNKNWDRIEIRKHNTPEQTRVCGSVTEIRDVIFVS